MQTYPFAGDYALCDIAPLSLMNSYIVYWGRKRSADMIAILWKASTRHIWTIRILNRKEVFVLKSSVMDPPG